MELVPLTIDHIRYIVEKNRADKFNAIPDSFSAETLAKSYFSKGSVSFWLVNDEPIMAYGIVNLDWHRGEAWIMHTNLFRKYFKTSLKTLKEELPKVAVNNGFRRVQATSFIANENLFEFLDFEHEATLRLFGPEGQTGEIYVRFFNVAN